MKKRRNRASRFVLCIAGSEPDLERWKVYRARPDESAAKNNYVRVIDESGEGYLYPARHFVPIDLPEAVERALRRAS